MERLRKTAREFSSETVLLGIFILSALPLIAVQVLPELQFQIASTSYLKTLEEKVAKLIKLNENAEE